MLTGEQLGKAIAKAIELKGVKKVDVANAFGVKPPSVQDWIKFGRISKTHIPKLLEFFSDVVGPAHWGLTGGANSAETRSQEATKQVTTLARRDKYIELVIELMGKMSADQKQRIVDFAQGVAAPQTKPRTSRSGNTAA